MKYCNNEIGIPTLEQIKEYIIRKKFNVNAVDVYEKYSKRKWLNSNGLPIKTLESMVNSFNGANVERKRKHSKYYKEPMDGELTCDEKMCLKLEALIPETGKIVFCAESPHETELVLGDNFEVKVEDGKTYVVRKLSRFPKTYEECCKVLGVDSVINDNSGYRWELLCCLQKLLVCRDAYWKIAGDWKPDYMYCDLYCIGYDGNVITWKMQGGCRLLAFPTEEMRDAFYENFKELIELVKELL